MLGSLGEGWRTGGDDCAAVQDEQAGDAAAFQEDTAGDGAEVEAAAGGQGNGARDGIEGDGTPVGRQGDRTGVHDGAYRTVRRDRGELFEAAVVAGGF